MAHGDKKGFMNNTLITFVLGLGFLLGVVLVEWRLAAEEGLVASFGNPATGPVGAVFYMMTGMHAFHVFTGLIFLVCGVEQRTQGFIFCREALGRGSRRSLLAFRRPGVDFLLPSLVPDRQTIVIRWQFLV